MLFRSESNDDSALSESMESTLKPEDFWWRVPRDSLFTKAGLQMLSIAAAHDGEEFDVAKEQIDREYEIALGKKPSQRHGGKFQTAITVYEEAGWLFRDNQDGKTILKLSDKGKQALLFLQKAPGFLHAFPRFLVECLSQYTINNPQSRQGQVRNEEYNLKLKSSDVFPYYTFYKIIRDTDNRIHADELRRFIFKLHNSSEIPETIKKRLFVELSG